jgi:hypothetical protein
VQDGPAKALEAIDAASTATVMVAIRMRDMN